ncbi:MAG: hypothetical protein ABEJ81_00700 [Haloferacaceae archaeon]
MPRPGEGDRTRRGDRDPLDRAFEMLCHPRRRRILTTFAETDPGDGAFAPDAFRADGEDPDRVGTELHHVHLPKLADAGYVDWDRDAGRVRRGPTYDEVEPLLRALIDRRADLSGEWP